MSKLDDWVERALFSFVRRAPGWLVGTVVAASYLGSLLIPVALHVNVSYVAAYSLLGTSVAGLIAVAWIVTQFQAKDRRHLLDWTSNLRSLDYREFEWLVGELFRREGWNVDEVGGHGAPDGNIDLKLTRGTTRAIVQCKRWTARDVDVKDIREFAGTLLREGLPANAGMFVTFSNFTPPARAEAAKTGINLIDRDALHERLEKARKLEPCPKCASPMVLGHSVHGWWFRCVAEGCDGKRHLGSDQARAVQLLTEVTTQD